jgi:uncharacterized protein YegJ (DUF2314 family)
VLAAARDLRRSKDRGIDRFSQQGNQPKEDFESFDYLWLVDFYFTKIQLTGFRAFPARL